MLFANYFNFTVHDKLYEHHNYIVVCLQISINQRYVRNAFYDNFAFAYNRSTIFLKSAKFEISYNYFLNPYNVYELVTFNRTKYDLSTFQCIIKYLCLHYVYIYVFMYLHM